jgi:hypothetical protein
VSRRAAQASTRTWQSLGRTPGFTLIAIITLGLGIGANTSMFSILDAYMLRPGPYADREHLDRS